MNPEIIQYNNKQTPEFAEICNLLAEIINPALSQAENKIWHAHPVWFFDGNPIVGYSIQKKGVRLMFWSGADFEESGLNVIGAKFKDASIFYNTIEEVIESDIIRWLDKSIKIQWDYKNLIKRKGQFEKLVV